MKKNNDRYTIAFLIGLIVILLISLVTQQPETVETIKEVVVEKPVYKEVEKIVEIEVEKIVEVEVSPQYTYQVTSAEREMLARIVYLEANIESIECQMAVASVVFNRLNNGYWGDTLKDVIYSPYQFSPSNLIWKTTPTETNYEAVDYVLKNGTTLPEYVLYFRANYGFSETVNGYCEYIQIDHTFFGYLERDKDNLTNN